MLLDGDFVSYKKMCSRTTAITGHDQNPMENGVKLYLGQTIRTAHGLILLNICAELLFNPIMVSKYIERTRQCL